MSSTKCRHPRIHIKQITLILCATVLLLLALLSSDLLPMSQLFTPVPPPQTLQQLVGQAPLIFIGQVGPPVRYMQVGGYSQDGSFSATPIDPYAVNLVLTVTDFQLYVEQVIRDDGAIAAGKPIIAREPGAVTAEYHVLAQSTSQATIAPGERYLFILASNPDHMSYGFHYGAWGRLLIDEEGVLHVSNGLRTPLRFGENADPITLDEMIRFVEERTPAEAPSAPDIMSTNRPVVPFMPLADRSSIWTGFRWVVPDSLQEIVDHASLIVIAEVGEVVEQYNLEGVGQNGQPMGAAYGLSPARMIAADVLLNVDQVIRDDGAVADQAPVVLRVPGVIDEFSQAISRESYYPFIYTGDRYLFLLTRNPDGTYGLYHSPWSRLIVDGEMLRASNGPKEPLQFDENEGPVTLEAFVELVENSAPPAVAVLDPLPLAFTPYAAPISPLATPSAAPVSPLATPQASDSGSRETAVRYNPPSSVLLRIPGSLEELLSRASLIVIGEVGPIERYTEFEPMETTPPTTNAAGNLVPGQPVVNLLLPGTPMTEFRLIVDDVIRDDGKVAAGEPIILRSLGRVTEELAQASKESAIPATFTGDRYLFLLSPYPDGEAYAFYYNVYSRLIIGGDMLRVSSGQQPPLQFGDEPPVTLDELVKRVKGES